VISFAEMSDGYVFKNDSQEVAVGVYDDGSFELLHNEEVLTFSNAMQAFSYLRSNYEPQFPVSTNTQAVFTQPAPQSSSLTKYKHNSTLESIGHARYVYN